MNVMFTHVLCLQDFDESDDEEDIEETASELIEKYNKIEGNLFVTYCLFALPLLLVVIIDVRCRIEEEAKSHEIY